MDDRADDTDVAVLPEGRLAAATVGASAGRLTVSAPAVVGTAVMLLLSIRTGTSPAMPFDTIASAAPADAGSPSSVYPAELTRLPSPSGTKAPARVRATEPAASFTRKNPDPVIPRSNGETELSRTPCREMPYWVCVSTPPDTKVVLGVSNRSDENCVVAAL